jgi:RNA polymerase sigma factor (sigma-70 family)
MEPHKEKSTKKRNREKLILAGLKQVEKVHSIFVYRYQLFKRMSKDDLADMKQDCVVEMIHAVDRFDPSKNVKLSTYLNPRIQGFFKDALKKQTKQRALKQIEFIEESIDFICGEMDEVLSLNKEQAIILLEELNITNDNIEDLLIDISHNANSYEVFDSLASLPDTRIYIILGYYVMDKSIKELSTELGFKPDTGWVYRMKREGIEKLQELLVEKRILKEDTI